MSSLIVRRVSCEDIQVGKRTREQLWCDDAVSTAPAKSLENKIDSSFGKKCRKLKSCVPSSHHCLSSRQTVHASNSPNCKDVSLKTLKDVAHKEVSVKTLKDVAPDSSETRPFIPTGPGFQAEIPVWIALTKEGKFYGSPGDTLRWLGTGVWPTYSLKKKFHYKKVGEGRSDSCSCASPRSTNCIKQHIEEAREVLEKDIDRAFYTWKFDQMGEVRSKSWTTKEGQRFEAVVKNNRLSNKSEKVLLSYYYNVFLIKRMRLLANSSDYFLAG
ncbi:hypothetical protein EUTSA_v10002074mg [Eutrema salsugineum]|uniref:ELM2 domain-containing protein n=1 Tax=Eutrema salsugineum TaxID=72664 RepID=V4MCQ1_EUTSA|nr:hypothetical protein EUTSA_v10002074mg [Eutrema salsugineum]